MLKKELNKMKKEFKLDSTLLNIKEIYSVYIKKDTKLPLFSRFSCFESLDTETQELYLLNYKKILGGTLNTKLFELNFNEVTENSSKHILYKILMENINNTQSLIDDLVNRLINNYNYDSDIVATFVKGEYWCGKKASKDYDLTAEDDIISSIPFIMGSFNKIEPFKKTLTFNYEEKEFKPSNVLDVSINLDTPLNGFLFPSIDDGISDINKLIFYNSKPKEINYLLLENVLQCNMKLTAEEEKLCFVEIVKDIVGDSVKSEVIDNLYSAINNINNTEEDESCKIGLTEMKSIFKSIGTHADSELEAAYESQCGRDYEFDAANILPDYKSKSLKIWNDNLSISINPNSLNSIKQIKGDNGEKCLLIQLQDDIVIDGFKLKSEE